MIIDMTAELAPILWGMLGLLFLLAGAIVASIDPEIAEVFLGDRRLLLVTAALAFITIVALIAAQPEIATGFALPFR